jgi:hypothetical protein
VIIEMTYDEAAAIVEAFTAGIENDEDDWQPSAADTLQAVADRNRLEAIRPACAFATVWREDFEKPEFERPPIEMVGLVEYLIGEPIWTKRLYSDAEIKKAEFEAAQWRRRRGRRPTE